MKLELGHPVRCTDGPLGELADVVIDPRLLRITHLVVAPRHRHGLARLVPIDQVTADGGVISLACTLEDVEQFPVVREFAYVRPGELPATDRDWDLGIETSSAVPYAPGYGGLGQEPLDSDRRYAIVFDLVPRGEIEIRRSSVVSARNGERLGHVGGFLVDPQGRLDHVLLERGHLWRRRELAIPIATVTGLETDSVTLGLVRGELGALRATPVPVA